MKNKICLIIVLFLIFILFFNVKRVNAKEDYLNIHIKSWNLNQNRNTDVLNDLKDNYGYNGEYLPKQLKIDTNLTLEPIKKFGWRGYEYTGNFNIVSPNCGVLVENIPYGTAFLHYGFKKEVKNEGESVNDFVERIKGNTSTGVIVAEIVDSIKELPGSYAGGSGELVYELVLKYLYAGQDLKRGKNLEIDSSEFNSTRINNYHDSVDELQEAVDEFGEDIKEKWDFAKNFLEHPIDTVLYLLVEVFRIIPDVIQMAIDFVKTIPLGIVEKFENLRLTYKYSHLTKDRKPYTVINRYVSASEYQAEKGSPYNVEIDNEEEKFDKFTQIPYIPFDLYALATDDIEFFDVNFFETDEERHEETSLWMTIRNFIVGALYGIVLLVFTIFGLILIYSQVKVIFHISNNPESNAKSSNTVKRILVSMLLLMIAVFIMIFAINGGKLIINTVGLDNTSKFPITVNVKDLYSFNTNLTGYVRYMTNIENVEEYATKAIYTLLYTLLVITNLAAFLSMIIRIIAVYILSFRGLFVVISYARGSDSSIGMAKFQKWMLYYVIFTCIPMVHAIGYKFILDSVENSIT